MTLTLRDARARFFAGAGFDETSYRQRWQYLRIGPLPVRLRMTPAYQAALVLHDVHHVTTGYGADVVGEVELAAWEIGARGDRRSAAFRSALPGILALVALGSFLVPGKTHAAFVRGRGHRSLYGSALATRLLGGSDASAYDLSLREIQDALGLGGPEAPATWRDHVAFAAVWVASLMGGAAFLAATPLLLAWSVADEMVQR